MNLAKVKVKAAYVYVRKVYGRVEVELHPT